MRRLWRLAQVRFVDDKESRLRLHTIHDSSRFEEGVPDIAARHQPGRHAPSKRRGVRYGWRPALLLGARAPRVTRLDIGALEIRQHEGRPGEVRWQPHPDRWGDVNQERGDGDQEWQKRDLP